MRLWTLHPQHLDAAGLVAAWRESLLAQKVLQGRTVGYRNHPQLARFKALRDPAAAAATYLAGLHAEAQRRGYRFDATKIGPGRVRLRTAATRGQLRYEWEHLKNKLRIRNPAKNRELQALKQPVAYPLFEIVPGEVERWEIR